MGDVTDVSDLVFEFDLITPKDIFESVCSSVKVDGCTLNTTGVNFEAAHLHTSYQMMANAASDSENAEEVVTILMQGPSTPRD